MGPGQLSIEIVPHDAHVTLLLTGEIDMFTAQSLRDAALSALRQHSTTLHVNVSGVTFMDSTGLEALLATRRRVTLAGGALQLVDPARSVMRVLEITGVSRFFEIEAEPATPVA